MLIKAKFSGYLEWSLYTGLTVYTEYHTGPRGDIGRGLIRHVIQILTCNVHYIIYFNHAFDNTCIL